MLDYDWLEGWLEFKERRVQGTNLEVTLAQALGKELVGLSRVLKMHGVPFTSMEWTFRSRRMLIQEKDDSLFLFLLKPHCGLSREEILSSLGERE